MISTSDSYGEPGATWAGRFDALLMHGTHLPRDRAWAIVWLSLALAGLLDRATGTDLWMGPLYLIVICFSAWSLGWREAMLAGLCCVASSFSANGLSAYPLGAAAFVPNMVMRIVAVAIIVMLMSGLRRSYNREWQHARRDSLTGALNRQAFLESAGPAANSAKWGVLAYIDLDGFKQINDRFGHGAGDETLRAFAQQLRRHLRPQDLFARVGGDEFLLFLPVGAQADAQRLAKGIEARIGGVDLPYRTGCSVGVLVVEVNGGGVSGCHIEQADQLMYEAKRRRASWRTDAVARLDAKGVRSAA